MDGLDADDDVELIVGGRTFRSHRSILMRQQSSLLARMASGSNKQLLDRDDGVIHLDLDPDAFAVILNYLRHGGIYVPATVPLALVHRQADFLCLEIEPNKPVYLDRIAAEPEDRTMVFQVAGVRFEVSRKLLMKHPETLLGRLCINEGKPDGTEYQPSPNGEYCFPMFWLQDPGAFSLILEWYKSGRMFLPLCGVSIDALVQACDFFKVPVNAAELTSRCEYYLDLVDKRYSEQRQKMVDLISLLTEQQLSIGWKRFAILIIDSTDYRTTLSTRLTSIEPTLTISTKKRDLKRPLVGDWPPAGLFMKHPDKQQLWQDLADRWGSPTMFRVLAQFSDLEMGQTKTHHQVPYLIVEVNLPDRQNSARSMQSTQ